MIRILLVDDQNLVQQGIKSLLEQDPDMKVIGTVTDGRSAISQTSKLRPDVVLLDIEMPGMNGITVTKYITHLAPETKVIILSSHEERKYLTQALMAGAKAYILKSSLTTDLKRSILAVNSGYSHIESRLLAKIFDPSNFNKSNNQKAANHGSKSAQSTKPKVRVKTPVIAEAKNTVEDTDVESVPTLSEPVSTDHVSDTDLKSPSIKVEDQDKPGNESIIAATTISKITTTVPKINLPYAAAPEPSELTTQGDKKFLPAVLKKSASQLSGSVGNRYYRTFRVAVNEKRYLQQLKTRLVTVINRAKLKQFWQGKISSCQPLINRFRAQMVKYGQKVMPLLKEWHQKGWLANLGLGILGLVAVIIIKQMFS